MFTSSQTKNAPAIKLMRLDVPYYGMMSKIDSVMVQFRCTIIPSPHFCPFRFSIANYFPMLYDKHINMRRTHNGGRQTAFHAEP